MMRLWIVLAALNGLCAIGLGAWAAHGLADLPTAAGLVRMGAQYQMWHALALIGVAWLSDDPGVPDGVIGTAGGCFVLGILLFCGTLYTTALEGRSEEHTSELQSLMRISYAVFCLKKKTNTMHHQT